jgi:branched-chain amino acid transport system permease protein
LSYIISMLTLFLIFAILGLSFNLLIGYSGLFSIAHAAFYGVGAYVAALTARDLGLNFLTATALGMLAAGALSGMLAVPALRVSGDYLVIASFGFQFIIYSVFNNLEITGAGAGVTRIPRPELFGYVFDSDLSMLALAAVFTALTLVLLWRLTNSPFGRVLRAMRDDEVAIQGLGKNITAAKVIVFVVSGALAAVAGALYAFTFNYIFPDNFTLTESVFIFTLVVVGGAGTLRGSLVGAVVVLLLPEALRFLKLSETMAAPIRQLTYSVLVIVFLIFRPQGILGEYAAIAESPTAGGGASGGPEGSAGGGPAPPRRRAPA